MNERLTWDISKLQNWDKNPREIKEKGFENLKKQLLKAKEITGEYLFEPLLITPAGVVLGGNMRLRALKALGVKDVWVNIVDPKNEEDMMALALAANDRAGYYSAEDLLGWIEKYPDFKWGDYSVDLKEPVNLQVLIDRFAPINEDDAPDVAEGEPDSQLGQIYLIGRHRLLCGDSTDLDAVEKLMGGGKADMVFTDPPYGVDYEGKTKDKLKIQNDEKPDVFREVLVNYAVVAKLGASFYVCCPAGNNFKDFLLPFEEECHVSSTIIWVKNSMVLGHGDYNYQHEPILYGWLKNGTHKFYGDRTQTTVWQIDRPSASKDHPTMKPVALVVKAIRNSSKEGDIILDLFGGSGTTLIAAEQTGRTCFLAEIDPKYCDVIRKRYAKLIDKEEEWKEITHI
jgi:DNA modification methylase